MALNRELEPISDGNVQKFSEFHWTQQVKGKRSPSETEIDSGQSSPKKMAIELTSDEGNSPQICQLPADDCDEDNDTVNPSVECLNNAADLQVFEVPQETNSNTNTGTEILNGFPIYKLKKDVPFLNETLQLCMGMGLDQRFICSQVPVNIHEPALFIVDFQCVRHHDVVARDRGSFGRQSSPTRHVAVKVLPDGTIENIKTVKVLGVDCLEPGYEFYKIRRHYTWHKFIPGLSRIITRLEYKNVLFRYGLVQFKITEEDRSFTSNFKTQHTQKEKIAHNQRGTPQGSLPDHSKYAQAVTTPSHTDSLSPSHYINPKPLTAFNSSHFPDMSREYLQDTASSSSSLHTSEQPTTMSSDIVCGKAEIFNILQNADKPKPPLNNKIPDFSKLLTLLKCNDFLCDVSFVSIVSDNDKVLNPRTFAMGELQRHWLKSYCTGENPKSVVSISTRYKIANHFLTTLTCPLPIFVLRDDLFAAKHPSVLLALMTSLTNESEDYEYLASNLRRQGIQGMVYGTDGNYKLDAALEKTFPMQEQNSHNSEKNVHLCCFDKIREEITLKLEDLNVKTPDSMMILREIFGSSDFNESLVDQKSEVKFREMLATIDKKWPAAFRHWFTLNNDNTARPLSETIRKCMLRPVRTAAGLGNPPVRYNNKNNSSKCIDDAIEELQSSLSVDLTKIHEVVKLKAVESQITEFVKAMYNMGDLRLAKAYQHLKVSLIS